MSVKSEWRTGALVVDTETGRTGRVMDRVGPYLQLRPREEGASGTPTPIACVLRTQPSGNARTWSS
jgi:hypothetical protein